MSLARLPQFRGGLCQSRHELRPAIVQAPTLLQNVGRLMCQVMHVGDVRVLLLKDLHAAIEIGAVIRRELPWHPRSQRGPFQFDSHRFLRRMFH